MSSLLETFNEHLKQLILEVFGRF